MATRKLFKNAILTNFQIRSKILIKMVALYLDGMLGLMCLGGGTSEETVLAQVVVQALQALVPKHHTPFKSIEF